VYTPAYVTVGAKKWAKLPDDVRAILEQTARETQAYVYQQAAALEVDLLNKIKAGGVKVNEADKDAFIKASGAIYDEFSGSVPGGGELVKKAQQLGKSG
jgi:TRAP-type C4-dicarboxylate transport system substrate-binding protein